MCETVLWLLEVSQCMTSMLTELGLPSFNTLIFNSRVSLSYQCQVTQNGFIGHIRRNEITTKQWPKLNDATSRLNGIEQRYF